MTEKPWSPMMVMPALAFVMAATIPLLRLLRARRLLPTRAGRCDRCGSRGSVVHVHFLKNTGMLILRQTSTLKADLCRGCGLREGALMTLHTAVLGWWGMISFVITCVALPMNLLQMWWLLSLLGPAAAAANTLDLHREYALNLLATKDRDTVVDVLARQTGATHQNVSRYLDRLV
jgi:hypothetical protein